MDFFTDEHDGSDVLYLTRRDVVRCCADLDPVAIAGDTLRAHAKGDTEVPEEAYLGWETASGQAARSLAMPGAIVTGPGRQLGLKIINASLGNIGRGLPRSQGFTLIFDPETARPLVIMEAAYISAMRTAAVSFAAAGHLARPGVETVALIGCGTLAKAHLLLLPATIRRVRLFDVDAGRAVALATALRADPRTARLEVEVADGVQACVRGAGLVIPVTTVTEGYLPYAWLEPGSVVIHVSLDDVLPDVVNRAEAVLVDDWGLVSHDRRRLLGRMYRSGDLLAPDGSSFPGRTAGPGARRVDSTIGEVLLGTQPGRRTESGVVLVNPFGMSIQDVALGSAVFQRASALGLGTRLPI